MTDNEEHGVSGTERHKAGRGRADLIVIMSSLATLNHWWGSLNLDAQQATWQQLVGQLCDARPPDPTGLTRRFTVIDFGGAPRDGQRPGLWP